MKKYQLQLILWAIENYTFFEKKIAVKCTCLSDFVKTLWLMILFIIYK